MAVSVFDIIGPVMVGPSSSHTAGAAKLGSIARRVCSSNIKKVDFFLHGSFAETCRGHGTGKALLGGILGMKVSDERIRDSFRYAGEKGMEFAFHTADLGDVHPNTVKFIMHCDDGSRNELVGSSIGGGEVRVTSVNNIHIEFSEQYPTIIIVHKDKPGIISLVTSIFASHNINIAFLKVFRQARGSEASMVIETDQQVSNAMLEEISTVAGTMKLIFIDV